MRIVRKVFGASTGRVEDRDLVRGSARFVADIRLPGMLHAAFVRSPHSHARIISIDDRAALALPGVSAVLTAEDMKTLTTTNRLVVALPDKTYKQQRDRFILADGETVHVGEAIAMVIASDPYVAEDAAYLVEIEELHHIGRGASPSGIESVEGTKAAPAECSSHARCSEATTTPTRPAATSIATATTTKAEGTRTLS